MLITLPSQTGDDDDPDLLNELQALSLADDDESPPPRAARPAPPPPGAPLSTDSSTISLLQDRITNYTVAEKNAKANGESSRARRWGLCFCQMKWKKNRVFFVYR